MFDLVYKFFCRFVSENYPIRDVDFYDSMTSNSNHWDKSGVTFGIDEYSSNGWKFGATSTYKRVTLDSLPSVPFQMEFEIVSKGTGYINALFINPNHYINFKEQNNQIQIVGTSQSTVNTSCIGKFTLKVYSNKFELYKDDTMLKSVNCSAPTMIGWECGTQSTRWIQIKDIIIQEL